MGLEQGYHADVDDVAQVFEVGLVRFEFVVDIEALGLDGDPFAHEHEAVGLARTILGEIIQ